MLRAWGGFFDSLVHRFKAVALFSRVCGVKVFTKVIGERVVPRTDNIGRVTRLSANGVGAALLSAGERCHDNRKRHMTAPCTFDEFL